MSTQFFQTPARATNSDGVIAAGARWFFYVKGTLTPQSVYSDESLGTPLGAVVQADSGGQFPAIYLDSSKQYRAILKSDNVTLLDFNVPVVGTGTGSGTPTPTPAPSGAILSRVGGGTLRDENGAVWNSADLLNSALEITAGGKLIRRNGALVFEQGQIDLDDVTTGAWSTVQSAVTSLQGQGTATTQRIAAAEGQINLRATTGYVDGQIAAATLGQADLALFNGINARLTTAEVDINSVEAAVSSRATLVDLNAQGARVTTAEQAINALNGTISTKVASTTFAGLETRVSAAEANITAMGGQASAVTALGSRLSNAEAFSTNLAQVVTANNNAFSSYAQTNTTTLNNLTSTVTTFQGSINGLGAQWGVRADVNNRVSGIRLNNDGSQADFEVVADTFRVWGTGLQSAVAPFEVSNGVVNIKSAFIKDLSVGTLKLSDGSVTNSGGSSNAGLVECVDLYTYVLAVGETIVMPHPGDIIISGALALTFTAGNAYAFQIVLSDGNTDFPIYSGTGNSDHFIPMTGKHTAAAGTYTLRIDVAGTPGVSINPGGATLLPFWRYK